MLIRRDVYKMVVPVFTEQLFIMSMGVLNTIIASGIGKEAVSAIGMVDSINNIFIYFFNSLAIGGTVIVAQYIGQRNEDAANNATKQALFSSVAISIFITLLIGIFNNNILQAFFGNADKEVLSYSAIYFKITLLTYPFAAFSFVASGVLRASGHQDKPMKINIIINIITIILSYILTYGLTIENLQFRFVFHGMEVKGAAIALFIARFSGFALFLYAICARHEGISFKGITEFRLNISMQKRILGIGIPSGIETIVFNLGKFVQLVFIATLGTISIASNTISWSVFGVLIIPGSACSIVATTMVGNLIGMGDHEGAKKLTFYLVKFATVCKVIISIIVFPLAALIATIYSKDPDVVKLTSQIIMINAIAIPILWPASFIIPSGLRGTGDVKGPMIISIISLWFFRVLIGYVFCIPLGFGIVGVWIAMYLDWIARGIIYYFRLNAGKWKGKTLI